ncbi:MAG: hypothetical protein QOI36_2468, partial [Pseudonocardiales bacterium]|nr:hypothetical protein [Pseudonocardiales bacterium]
RLVEPPREFAASVVAAGGTTRVAVTEPGASVVLPAAAPDSEMS